MFTDSDWDNSAPTPLAPPSPARRAAALAAAVVAGLVLGVAMASWWWAAHSDSGAKVAASPATPSLPTPAEVIASAPPAGGPATGGPATKAVDSPAAPPSSAPIAVRAPAPPVDPAAASRRKELAWSSWYEKPRECIEDRRGERLVECANHYIRARREFEASYSKR
jgi:hypothetical protein